MQQQIRRLACRVLPVFLLAVVAIEPARAGDKEKAKQDAAYQQIQELLDGENYKQALAAAEQFL